MEPLTAGHRLPACGPSKPMIGPGDRSVHYRLSAGSKRAFCTTGRSLEWSLGLQVVAWRGPGSGRPPGTGLTSAEGNCRESGIFSSYWASGIRTPACRPYTPAPPVVPIRMCAQAYRCARVLGGCPCERLRARLSLRARKRLYPCALAPKPGRRKPVQPGCVHATTRAHHVGTPAGSTAYPPYVKGPVPYVLRAWRAR